MVRIYLAALAGAEAEEVSLPMPRMAVPVHMDRLNNLSWERESDTQVPSGF